MREGLRSSDKLLADKCEVLPVKSPAKIEVGNGSCLSDDKVSKFSTSETQDIPPKENLKHKEGKMGERVSVDCSNESRKRNRIDSGAERGDDKCLKRQKLREGDMVNGKPLVRRRIDSGVEREDDLKRQKLREGDILNGKPPVPRRTLRSMTALKSEGKEINEKEQINSGLVEERLSRKVCLAKKCVEVESGCVAARTRGKLVAEEKRAEVGSRYVAERTRGKVVAGAKRVDLENGCVAGRTRGKVGDQDKNDGENGFASTKTVGNGSVASRTRGKVGSDWMVFETDNGSLVERSEEKSIGLESCSVDATARGIVGNEKIEVENDLDAKRTITEVETRGKSVEVENVFDEEITRESVDSEEKMVEAEIEEIHHSKDSCEPADMSNAKSGNKLEELPKCQGSDQFREKNCGTEEEMIEMGNEESDHGVDSCQLDSLVNTDSVQQHEKLLTSQESDGFQKETRGTEEELIKVGMEEADNGVDSSQLDNLLSAESGHQHGKLTEPQESGEFQKSFCGIENRDVDKSSRQDSLQLNNELCENVKRKRGRPPKISKKSAYVRKGESIGQEELQFKNKVSTKLKHKLKLGRPPKSQQSDGTEKKQSVVEDTNPYTCLVSELNSGEINNLKPRRGRPPKAQKSFLSEKQDAKVEAEVCDQLAGVGSSHLDNEARRKLKLKSERLLKSNKGNKVGAKRRGRPPKYYVPDLNHNVGKNCPLSGKKFSKEYNLKLQKAEKISKHKKARGDAKQKAREKSHSRDERQAVRAKIQELLSSAGWTIEHRPRNGRVYMDAVYVNPEGRTHWSITLAYRVLKKCYEDGGGDSATQKPGFKFSPIPEEELHILTKVMSKQRCDKDTTKKKRKREEDREMISGATKKKKWKVQKRKQGDTDDDTHKMLKGRKKLKSIRCKEDDMPAASGDGKRHETHGRKRCSLMVRRSQDAESAKDGYVLYNGKRTVLAWMIDNGTVLEDAEVQYMKRKKARAVMRGSVTPNGIKCDCCCKILTNSEFETHAGGESCQPLQNIYLENGASLLQCQLDSWLKEDVSAHKGFHFVDVDGEDPNDDTCGICGDGGNLICCDSCPSTFHQSCLEIRKFPSGLWHCMYCSCKFCGMVGENSRQKDDAEASVPHVLLACHLCEDKYHPSCIQEDIMNVDPHDMLRFCGKKCQELYERLQMLFGVRHELEDGFSCTFVRRFEVDSDISSNEIPRKVDCNSKVAVALQIMDECFVPVTDHRSKVNLIRNIVYNFGSNFNRLNYRGFFTAILERGDEMIAAASIRIHGNRLAEMPFIGTRYRYRRQGMCRRLLNAIEMALCSLNVGKLVIPAISELMETWTSAFGFKPLEGSDKQILRNMNIMAFPGVDMLQKPLLRNQFAENNLLFIGGSNLTELAEHDTMEEMKDTLNERCPVGFDLNVTSDVGFPHSDNLVNEHVVAESGFLLNGCSEDVPDVTAQTTASEEHFHQSAVYSNQPDSENGFVTLPDSLHDACESAGYAIVNTSQKKRLMEFDLNAPSMTDGFDESTTDLQQPDGFLNETADPRTWDVIDERCQDKCTVAPNGSSLLSYKFDINTELSNVPGSDTEMMERNSDFRGSSCATPGVALHCASGRGSPRGATEAMILSNQAN